MYQFIFPTIVHLVLYALAYYHLYNLVYCDSPSKKSHYFAFLWFLVENIFILLVFLFSMIFCHTFERSSLLKYLNIYIYLHFLVFVNFFPFSPFSFLPFCLLRVHFDVWLFKNYSILLASYPNTSYWIIHLFHHWFKNFYQMLNSLSFSGHHILLLWWPINSLAYIILFKLQVSQNIFLKSFLDIDK